MATVKLFLRYEKADKQGNVPLYIRIIKDRNIKTISLKQKINPKHWNDEENKVKKSHPNSQHFNNWIANKIAEAEGEALKLETNSKHVPTKQIKDAIMGKASDSFIKYAEAYQSSLEKKGSIGTLDKVKAVISKLKAYLGNKDLLFDEVTVTFIKKYEAYLSNDLGNTANTIYSNIKIIRKLINDAISEEIFPAERNPFLRHKLKWEKTTKSYCTEDELKALEKLELAPSSMKFHHRNIYIFAAYTGGLRISDILLLKWSNYVGDNIIVSTKKTNNTVSIKLTDKAKAILNLYQNDANEPHHFIFPFLKNDVDYSDPKTLFKAISSQTAYTNADLKDLAALAEISHPLNFHTSRHSFGTIALSKGMRIEHVSKLMGHEAIKTTQIYAKIVNADLDNSMDLMNK